MGSCAASDIALFRVGVHVNFGNLLQPLEVSLGG